MFAVPTVLAALPVWVNDVTLACTAIVTIIAAATAITKIVLNAVHGITAEVDERIRLQLVPIRERLDKREIEVDEQFKHIIGELSFNGGRSTKDLMLQNQKTLDALTEAVATLTPSEHTKP